MKPQPLGRIPPGVRAVFFDAVGTLLHPDPSAAEAYATVGRRFGSRLALAEVRRRFAAAFRAQEQFDLAHGLRTSEERERQRWRLIVTAVLDDISDVEGCFRELHAHFARPQAWHCQAQTAEVIAALRSAGYGVGLASNFDHRLRGLVEALPELVGVQRVVISSEVGWKKPAPEFFAHLIEQSGLSAERVLLVGDDLDNDFTGGRAAGMRVLFFDPEDACAELATEDRITSLDELISRGVRP